MTRRRKERLAPFEAALQAAHDYDRGLTDTPAPQPHCLERADLYADYDYPLPTAEEAQERCEPCKLRELCLASAEHIPPAWGIRGGFVWVDGRKARNLRGDDPRVIGSGKI